MNPQPNATASQTEYQESANCSDAETWDDSKIKAEVSARIAIMV